MILRRPILPTWLCLVLTVALPAGLQADKKMQAETSEAGRPLMRYFSFRDYHAHHQMWVATEDSHGIPFFGNKGCVLEYDGVEWYRIPIGTTTFVRGLACAADGTIYVGAVDELGYIEVSPLGGKRFVSLRDRLPPEHRTFGDIWRTYATKDGIFFATNDRLFRWRDGRFHVWSFPGDATTWMYACNDRIFIHRRGEALQELKGDTFVPFGDAPFLRRNRIASLVVLRPGFMLACSAEEGFALINDRTGELTPFPTEIDAWVRHEGIQSVTRAGLYLLVASRQAGVTVTDTAGLFLRRFDEADGLHDPLVKSVFASNSRQVWFCHNNGLNQVLPTLASTLFNHEQGLDGTSLRAIIRHRDQIHVATGRGVFRLEPASPERLANARFAAVPGLTGRFYALLSTPGGLLAGENEGLYFLRDGATQAEAVPVNSSVVLLAASALNPGRVWAGTLAGLVALDPQGGGWRVTPAPAALRFEARSLAELSDGTVWLGTPTRGVARVRGLGGPGEPEVTFYKESHGLPAGHGGLQVARAGEHLVLTCASGDVLRYDPAKDAFAPAPAAPVRGRIMSFDPDGTGGEIAAWLIRPARDGNVESLCKFDADGNFTEVHLPDLIGQAGPLQAVYADPADPLSRGLWLAGAEGLARAGLNLPMPLRRITSVILRSALLDGRADWPTDRLLSPGPHRLSFRFSASAYGVTPEFSTRLEGFDPDWTPFTPQRDVEFTNLPPGRYVLHVRAGSQHSPGPPAAVFSFTVLAPWWNAWWARGGAGLLVLAAIAGLVHWRSRTLRHRSAQLEKTVAARTAELTASEEQLRTARDAAEAANRAKSAFLAHMSHELRTPLNGILGYAQVLRRDPAQTAGARERLGVIVNSGEHLLALINEVLDLAKVEAGKMELHPAEVALPQLVQGVADLVRPRCEEKNLAFGITLAPGLPRLVRTDEQKLRQVLLNLLVNAIKFTDTGHVTLAATPAGAGRVRFTVEDTGTGIEPARLPRLFQPFDSTGQAAAQGTGLGLALSQRLTELLGGRIDVVSTPGRGSRFWFDLPLPATSQPAPIASGARLPTGYQGARRQVLVVDDDATNRAVLRELLAPLGFTLAEAADGAAAVAAFHRTPPDLVLLDLRFEDGPDGLAIARSLRAAPQGERAKIVAVSASVFESDRHQALAAGCDAFLAKPFKEEQLHCLLGELLGLTWEYAAEPAAPAGGTAPLDDATRAELLDLARRGDAHRLRERLAALAADPHHAALARQLDALAAGFQMKRLRELLAPDAPDR